MQIIPRIIWLGNTANRRYELIPKTRDATMQAAAIAIMLEKTNIALEWLEQGRSIVWNQLLQLRTPIDELSIANPSLAATIKQVAYSLENAFQQNPLRLWSAPVPGGNFHGSRGLQSAREHKGVRSRIRIPPEHVLQS
ncbi:hypothetical protein FRC07_004832, partial [Ceratobasidium sp. 392]